MQMNSFLLQVTGSYYLAKRRLKNILIASSNCRVRKLKKAKVARRFWIRPGRCGVWWSNFQSRITHLEEWKEIFRMSKQTFDVLCHQLRPFISKTFTQMRAPVSVEAQVAVTLSIVSICVCACHRFPAFSLRMEVRDVVYSWYRALE